MPVRRDDRNGQWRYRKVVKLPDGRRVRVAGTPSVNTRAAAEAAERAHIARLVTPELDKSRKEEAPALQAFVPEFMETYVRANNKPSERMAKEYIFRRHLLPAFGRRRLDDISTRDIEKFKADKLARLRPSCSITRSASPRRRAVPEFRGNSVATTAGRRKKSSDVKKVVAEVHGNRTG